MNAVLRRTGLVAGALAVAACAENTTAPTPGSADIRGPVAVLSSSGATIVTESDVVRQAEDTPPTNNWVLYTRPSLAVESGDFVIGPDTPPEGVGSFRTKTVSNDSKVYLFNYDHVGTPLANITGISYSTWKAPASAGVVAFPALNIQIDINGGTYNAGEFRTFVFEPYLQNGFVDATGMWESRDAYNGGAARWWSTGTSTCPMASPCTWSALIASFPGATILGGFGINQGSYNPGLDGASDALSIAYGGNSITYDFEPYVTAASKEACKNGGWMNVKRADGSSFKNQGDCVSYVNNGK